MHIRPFEIGLIVVFVLAALIGVFVLSRQDGGGGEGTAALYGNSFEIWGTADQKAFDSFLDSMVSLDKALDSVTYREIDPRRFESELVNAIAEGRSPEMILIPHTHLATLRTKLQPIALSETPARTFLDTYIDGAQVFLLSDGVFGVPFAVDPLVMYWNRDIFASSGLARAPRTWEELLYETTPAIVRRDSSFDITQSAMSFGEYTNVTNAKEILSMLFIQAGSTIVDEANATYRVTLNQSQNPGTSPAESVISFYTQFANPSSAQYSWNRGMIEDRRAFLQGTLALYFGMGSERRALEEENANLNFDMAAVPQGADASVRRNYGEFYAFAIPRGSTNQRGATVMATFFTRPENAIKLSEVLGFAPVHLSNMRTQGDVFTPIINDSALIARAWLDPDPEGSDMVFQDMIEATTGGTQRINEVIRDAVDRLQRLF
jgi:ABC-type glycerol-3-phosphate transport system substrate-binding protein